MTYGLEFREKVLATKAQENLTIAEIAKRFLMSALLALPFGLKSLSLKKPHLKLDIIALKKIYKIT